MSCKGFSDADHSAFQERIALAANYSDLTHHEAEALDAIKVRLRRYGPNLFLSEGDRHRLYRIFEKAGISNIGRPRVVPLPQDDH